LKNVKIPLNLQYLTSRLVLLLKKILKDRHALVNT